MLNPEKPTSPENNSNTLHDTISQEFGSDVEVENRDRNNAQGEKAGRNKYRNKQQSPANEDFKVTFKQKPSTDQLKKIDQIIQDFYSKNTQFDRKGCESEASDLSREFYFEYESQMLFVVRSTISERVLITVEHKEL